MPGGRLARSGWIIALGVTGFGCLFAGPGPFLFGLPHDLSSGWTVPFIMFPAVYVVQMFAGATAGRARYV